MKAFLLHRDRDVDWEADPPPETPDTVRDLGLDTLLEAMSDDDAFLRDVALRVLTRPLAGPQEIVYRQRVLRDCVEHTDTAVELYNLAVETIAAEHHIWPSFLRTPESVLSRSVTAMEMFTGALRKLRAIRDAHAEEFRSPGMTAFFRMLEAELDDAWFETVDSHLRQLRFKSGVMVSATLGLGCVGTGYVLREPHPGPGWRDRITRNVSPSHTYRLPDRDETGARALSELRDRGVDLAADALARSCDHILSFFTMLRRELGFYVACVKAYEKLTGKGEPVCFPEPLPPGRPVTACRGLYDPCLSLRREERVVGNDIDAADADGVGLVVVTGANEGGKSTFLRTVGLAQLMAQAGMFVAAEAFRADVRTAVFTHCRREEDAEMVSGKFDEELARMAAVADRITPGGMVLFNESFAATNEREGSQVARQIVRALLDCGVKVVLVTHLYDLAHGLRERHSDDALFLRAERREDGTRTFRLTPGAPRPTSHGEDLYARVFGVPAA
ncbi:hypothetical protein ABZ832_09970 [Streptantibioticus parmotrematis]|uniref:MutS-related protein n=1 Tax=Streptantibioticus parmotrematis TaxID=2873249 RepID=UPI0033C985F5